MNEKIDDDVFIDSGDGIDGINDDEDVEFDFDANDIDIAGDIAIDIEVVPDAFARAREEMGEETEVGEDDFDDDWDEDFEEDEDENREDDLQLFKKFDKPVKPLFPNKVGRPKKNDNDNAASVGDTGQDDSSEANGTEEIHPEAGN
jgi:hypothetical protein